MTTNPIGKVDQDFKRALTATQLAAEGFSSHLAEFSKVLAELLRKNLDDKLSNLSKTMKSDLKGNAHTQALPDEPTSTPTQGYKRR